MRHWAGDPGCKFANKPQPPKPTANLAYESESSDDEEGFVYVGAATSNEQTNAAMMAFRSGASGKGSRPRPSQAQSSMAHANDATSSDLGTRVTPSSVERPMGFDNVFQIGQFKGKTYWEVLHRQPQFYVWAKKEGSRVPGIQQYVQWVDQFFEFRGGEIYLRDEPVQPPPALPGSTKKGTAKATPPYPPLPNKCQNCQEFSFRGSTGYTIRRTCLHCGHSSTEKREETPQYKPEDCPRESTDNRGASRSTHRAWCTFMDELPMDLRCERVALVKAVESTAQDKVSVIEAIARDDQEVLTPETVGRILGIFSCLVESECLSSPDTLTQTRLHELLQEAAFRDQILLEQDPIGDEIAWGLRDPEHIGYAAVETSAFVFHSEVPSSVSNGNGLVYSQQETRDMWCDSDPNIDAILDKGCNSACHSQYWMEKAEAKFKKLGYEVGWASKEGKVFSGLGSQGNKTQGCRVLPISSLNMQDDQNPIRGILESHQLQEGRSPMLLSLHAQSHLGLVKDLAKGAIHIEGRRLPIFRCSKTGLLMISLTGGLIDATRNFQSLPRSVIESFAVATWLEMLHQPPQTEGRVSILKLP